MTVDLAEGKRLLEAVTAGPWDWSWGEPANHDEDGAVPWIHSNRYSALTELESADAEAACWLLNNGATLIAELEQARADRNAAEEAAGVEHEHWMQANEEIEALRQTAASLREELDRQQSGG